MKKILGIILTVMMLLISVPHMSTNSFGVPSEADVIDYVADYTDAWIEIRNMSGAQLLWDQRNAPEDNIRSDSYIRDGEKLVVTVIIYDENGIFQDPLSHTIDAYLSPDDDYLGQLDFQHYIVPEDITKALFNLTFTMNDTLECKHDVYVKSGEVYEGTTYEIYDKLYINPYVTGIFSNTSVAWTGLHPGYTNIAADNNTYGYNVSAICYVDDVPEYVNVDYRLSINGTDMTQVGVTDFIPCENISYSMGIPPSTPLSETFTLVGFFNATASPLPFNFFIDVPTVIQAGAYTGEINFAYQVI